MNARAAIPTIRLDLSIPEHQQIYDAYGQVSASARAEWVRLTMLAGLKSREGRVVAAPATATTAATPLDDGDAPTVRPRSSVVLQGMFGGGARTNEQRG